MIWSMDLTPLRCTQIQSKLGRRSSLYSPVFVELVGVLWSQVDDLIATGGTMKAAIGLLQKVGATVVEAAVIIELPELKGKEKLGTTPLFVLVQKEGQ